MKRNLQFAVLLFPLVSMFIYGGYFAAHGGAELLSVERLVGLAMATIGAVTLIVAANNEKSQRQNSTVVVLSVVMMLIFLFGIWLCWQAGWDGSFILAGAIILFIGLVCAQIEAALWAVPRLLSDTAEPSPDDSPQGPTNTDDDDSHEETDTGGDVYDQEQELHEQPQGEVGTSQTNLGLSIFDEPAPSIA